MNNWSPNCSTAQMANNLVKWWKSKFLSGYKAFSVDSKETRASDTQELLESQSVHYQTSCTTPPLQSQSPSESNSSFLLNAENQNSEPKQFDQHHINLQEFSCGVSLDGGRPLKNTQERQEFSFTLYDFDGHGKITKDDITGLVTTIYEVLGSSVKVPHYGSKTIKVKLTVSPDQRRYVSATVIDHKDNKFEEKYPIKDFKIKEDPNIAVKNKFKDKKPYYQNKNKEQGNRKHYCCRKLDEELEVGADISDNYSDICSRVSENLLTSEDEKDESLEEHTIKCKKLKQIFCQKHSIGKSKTSNQCTNLLHTENQKECRLPSKKVKKRSSFLQRQELLNIIQSNMNKSNASFQPARKPCVSNNIENKHLLQTERKQLRHRPKRNHTSIIPFHCLADTKNPHFYVNLDSLQNTTQLLQGNCQYEKLVDAVMCVCNKKIPVTRSTPCKSLNHCKSYDSLTTPSQHQSSERPIISIENLNKNVKKSTRKLTEGEGTAALKKNIRKFPQVVLGHTSSPHHLRHRNRQEDQARAMAQVVKWLEQEFSSNLQTKGLKENYVCNLCETPNIANKHHPHHHVHEHIHHHYHHYHEAGVVV